MNPALRQARQRGARDTLSARLDNAAPPANPFRPKTKAHDYWQWGTEFAAKL